MTTAQYPCNACGRSGQRVERRMVEGLELHLCMDLTACRTSWPTEDQLAVARFVRGGRYA